MKYDKCNNKYIRFNTVKLMKYDKCNNKYIRFNISLYTIQI